MACRKATTDRLGLASFWCRARGTALPPRAVARVKMPVSRSGTHIGPYPFAAAPVARPALRPARHRIRLSSATGAKRRPEPVGSIQSRAAVGIERPSERSEVRSVRFTSHSACRMRTWARGAMVSSCMLRGRRTVLQASKGAGLRNCWKASAKCLNETGRLTLPVEFALGIAR